MLWQVEFHGLDGHDGPLYIGTGCFHRRETLCGRKFSKNEKISSITMEKKIHRREGFSSVLDYEERLKSLASCTFEQNTNWGKEVCKCYPCLMLLSICGCQCVPCWQVLNTCRWVWDMGAQLRMWSQGYAYNAMDGNQFISIRRGRHFSDWRQQHLLSH